MAPRGVYNSVIIEYNVKKSTFIEPYLYIFELILVPRYTTDCENFADVPDDVSDDTILDDNIPDDDISDDGIPDYDITNNDIPNDDIPDDTSDDILDDVSDNTSILDDISDIPDYISDDILGDIPDDIPDDMSIESMGEKDSASLLINIASEADTTYRASKVKDTLDGRCAVKLSGWQSITSN